MFESSFWSADYQTGVNVLFEKLSQGCSENAEILDLVTARISLEKQYGAALEDVPVTHSPTASGFNKDEGASLRQVFVSVLDDMAAEGKVHSTMALNLDRAVREPFEKWALAHKLRVSRWHGTLTNQIRAYSKRVQQVQKVQQSYYDKCRQLEMLDPRTKTTSDAAEEAIPFPDGQNQIVELAGKSYTPSELHELIRAILSELTLVPYKVAILGTYNNCSTGEDIVMWVRKRLDYKNVGKAERFGQGLIDQGMLRSVGRVGSKFINASTCYYQWQDKAFSFDPKAADSSPEHETLPSPTGINTMHQYLSGLLGQKEVAVVQQDIAETDEQYRTEVLELDQDRCELERTIYESLRFMERCERDRLRALKTVVYDLGRVVGSAIDPLAKALGRLTMQHQAIQPEADLRYMVESYTTGFFAPKVLVYQSFDNSARCQTFGTDIQSTAFFITLMIDYLTAQTKDMDLAEVVGLWTNPANLTDIHVLRTQLNTGAPFAAEAVLPQYPLPDVVATLKQYLLESQDSLVSFTLYDLLKNLYNTHSVEDNEGDKLAARLTAVATALSHAPPSLVKQLEIITNHLESVATDEKSLDLVCTRLAPYLLRPRVVSATNMKDRHPSYLVRDLICHGRTQIYAATAQLSGQAKQNRQRAVSNSEVSRRAHFEALNRELSRPSRSSSPGPNGGSPVIRNGSGLLPLTLSPSPAMTRTEGERRARVTSGKEHRKTRSVPLPIGRDDVDKPLPQQPLPEEEERNDIEKVKEEKDKEVKDREVKDEEVNDKDEEENEEKDKEEKDDEGMVENQEKDSEPGQQPVPQLIVQDEQGNEIE